MKYLFLLFVALTALLLSCREQPREKVVGLPEDPNKAPPELRQVWTLVREGNETQKEKARGKLLERIGADMQRGHVELWMGRPAREHVEETYSSSDKKYIVCTYYCRLPKFDGTDLDGTHLMTIRYRQTEDGLRVVRVEGPHFPD